MTGNDVPSDGRSPQPGGRPSAVLELEWVQDGEALVLVIEELDHRPFTRWDNAVVHRADGTELRPHPPWDLLSEPSRVSGFYTAYLDPEGLPMLVIATSSGDLQGRLDLESGEVTDLRQWR